MIVYGRHSRYNKAVQTVNNGVNVTLDDDVRVAWNKNDTTERVMKGELNRWDLVANRTLGNPLLWWALARRNRVKFPFALEAGKEVMIPDLHTLYGIDGVLK